MKSSGEDDHWHFSFRLSIVGIRIVFKGYGKTIEAIGDLIDRHDHDCVL
jgi:hypothetical protein